MINKIKNSNQNKVKKLIDKIKKVSYNKGTKKGKGGTTQIEKSKYGCKKKDNPRT